MVFDNIMHKSKNQTFIADIQKDRRLLYFIVSRNKFLKNGEGKSVPSPNEAEIETLKKISELLCDIKAHACDSLIDSFKKAFVELNLQIQSLSSDSLRFVIDQVIQLEFNQSLLGIQKLAVANKNPDWELLSEITQTWIYVCSSFEKNQKVYLPDLLSFYLNLMPQMSEEIFSYVV